jgi:serine/threonine protein kinase
VCGSRIYAAPELLAQTGHTHHPTVRLVAADALALDSFSLGLTLRHMLTGVFPGMSVLSYANAQGLWVPLLAGAALAVQRIWRGIRRVCPLHRRRLARGSAHAAAGISALAGAAATGGAAVGIQPAGRSASATAKRLPDKRCFTCVREYRYMDQISLGARNLIAAFAQRDPRQRLSAAEARQHEWMVGSLLPPQSGMPARALLVPESLCWLSRAGRAVAAAVCPQDDAGSAGAAGCQQISTPAALNQARLLPQHDAGRADAGVARSGSADARRAGTGTPAFYCLTPVPIIPVFPVIGGVTIGGGAPPAAAFVSAAAA